MNLFERLTITIVTNLAFYTIIGIFGFYLGFAITAWFFFFSVLLSYVVFILVSIIFNLKKGNSPFFNLKFTDEEKYEYTRNFSIISYFKRYKAANSILLIIFMFLVILLSIMETPIFIGTDPWIHISIIKFITDINYLPLNDYFGTFGFHIFGAVIHYFSGMDFILIPKFFVFYTIPISSLVVYVLLMRIFKNKNLAIFGILVLNFSSLGYLNMMFQFWPSSLALILGITLFFLLYVRLKSFTREIEPEFKQISSKILFSYLIFILLFISCLLIHSLIAVIFLVSYIWVYLIYFVKNYKRGFDLLLLGICLCIFFIFYLLDVSTGHFTIFSKLGSISWYYILFGIVGIGILEGLVLLHYRRKMIFTKGRYTSIIFGKSHKIFKRIEDKYLFPMAIILVVVLGLIFSIANSLLFNFNIITVFSAFDILIIWFFAIWGLIIFRYKTKGKPLLLWGLALGILLIAGISFDIITGTLSFFSRIFYLSSILIIIGFISYFHKLIKTNSIQKLRFKIFILLFTSFSIMATYLEISSSIEFYSLKQREVSTVQWYTTYDSKQNIIIAEFGWSSIFVYYDYPFNENNATNSLNSVIFFYTASNDFFNPTFHVQNGTNLLTDLKKNLGKDVFLILTDNFLLVSGFTLIGQLNKEEIEMYYNLTYLNRICISKSENGGSTPYYWVI
ncbi:MAG: hypothetical protein ACFFDB_03910 [Promethearchaeota archaeon]